MYWPSLTVIFSCLFMAYIAHSMWTLFSLFNPKACLDKSSAKCIKPILRKEPALDLIVAVSTKFTVSREKDLTQILRLNMFNVTETQEHRVNVTIPRTTRDNGTLFIHAFLVPHKNGMFANLGKHIQSKITTYIYPQTKTMNLMGDKVNDSDITKSSANSRFTVAHWRSHVLINVMTDDIAFDRRQVPQELFRFLTLTPESDYLPLLYIDELSYRIKDLIEINKSAESLPLTISYSPISVGKLRMWVNMQESIKTLHNLGFTEKDTDEVKGIFADTNLFFLMLTFLIAAFHLLFDFLAFKNDISFWKGRKDMVGLSAKTVLYRCVSTIIIFLYLMDEETSLLVLIPAGVGSLIEMWKVTKAFKVTLTWSGIKPCINFGTASDQETQTNKLDSEAMKYLSYLLWPLCIGGAVYSLLYVPHKSWYSWCINSLVNGVYALGFLFMLPQLFLNYKLKSVAHLPWRAFMYKAFNTFIDDVFAFIITMPTAHRLACFRDDFVFVIYLYQRWLYPVDKTRANEFGQTFDEKEDKKTK